MKSYDALVQLAEGKVRRMLHMLHTLALSPGTGRVGA